MFGCSRLGVRVRAHDSHSKARPRSRQTRSHLWADPFHISHTGRLSADVVAMLSLPCVAGVDAFPCDAEGMVAWDAFLDLDGGSEDVGTPSLVADAALGRREFEVSHGMSSFCAGWCT